ncbi:MAG: hypothetical protein QXG00_06570 [Candidatus Woesearchaeota archaeon]
MDETIITNWNSVVRPGDIIYHLGDFAFGDVTQYLSKLNGQIHLIIGSHDKNTLLCKNLFASYSPLKEIRLEENYIVMCHCAMRVWNKSHFNSWHLFGHSHGKLESQGKSFDVGVDTNGFFPWSYEQIKLKMSTLPNNINYINKELY